VNEFSNLTWADVRQWAQTEIEKLRVRNDSTELDYEQTLAVRGEIRALKRLLDLPKRAAQEAEMASSAMPTMTDL
jgi:hypothetical protein